MGRYLGLLLLGLAACSQQASDGRDLGLGTGDLSASNDLSASSDLSAPDDLGALDGPVGALTALTLVAGGLGGPGNADDTGTVARFNVPQSVAADGAGNLYISDSQNFTIRMVVLATGAVTTLAGTAGTSGFADGTGAAARFNSPAGVATDGAGNLYVADAANSTIRKVVIATGVVTTLAGNALSSGSTDGTGAAARFNSPQGVAADGAGNLFVADSQNSTIRKVVLATGVVTTLAGTAGMFGSADGTGAAARFGLPTGVAPDGAGNLNGDYESAYIGRPLPTSRRLSHEYPA